jgi:hypothetical protein
MKTHGNPEWSSRPSYLSIVVPRMLDVFGEAGITSTVFVVGADAAREDGVKAVSSIVEAGHEVASHSFEHEPWLHLYERSRLEEELVRTEEALTAAGAARPRGFRGPGYSLSPDLVHLLAERQYEYDASTLPTWIGPLARAYYFRGSGLSGAERRQRDALFGSAWEGLRPVHPYRWGLDDGDSLVELPVTTMPVFRLPIHVSYLLFLHAIRPALARAYFATALRLCRLRGVGPSILLHPLDLLDRKDARQLEFFPGMQLAATEKVAVVSRSLEMLARQFEVVGTGEHVRRLGAPGLRRTASAATAGPRK